MKKLFSLIALMVLSITLVGCTSNTTDYTEQIASLQQQITDLQTQKDALESQVEQAADLQSQMDSLQQQLDDLEAMMLDVTVTINVVDVDGNEVHRLFGFNSDENLSLLDILQDNFIVDATPTDYGTMLNNVNNMNVPYGSYIAIYQNGEMSMVGIDDITVHDGDSFTFAVTWWDTTQEAVYNSLQLFIDNQLGDYLNDTTINYYVLLGCDGLCDDNTTYQSVHQDSVLFDYVNPMTPTTVPGYFKAIMLAGEMTTDTLMNNLLTDLSQDVVTGPYGQTALGLIALDKEDFGLYYADYVANAISYYENSTPVDEGLDAGGLALVALSHYTDREGVQDLVDGFVNYVIANQLPSGGIKTKDMEYSGVTYPGTENAASISQVIDGLIANGIDPAGTEFTTTDGNLILRLTQFQLADGSFDWDLTDDIPNDKAFSTPQAFYALSLYYQFMNSNQEITSLYN